MVVVGITITIYTNYLGGTLYLARSVASAYCASTLHRASVLLIRFLLLTIQALSMLRAAPHWS